MSTGPELVTAALLRTWPLPEPQPGKHGRGQVLVVGGSPSTPGAAMLAGIAALRVGAGVLGLAVAASVSGPVAAAVPESAVLGLPELDGGSPDGRLAERISGCAAVLVGPGIDGPDVARDLLDRVVEQAPPGVPLVLDAFALGVLPGSPSVDAIRGRCLLTPNRSEAERLLDGLDDDADEPQIAAQIAGQYEAVVSYRAAVATPDGRTWSVPAGHAGLGTSGSGDVLAGAITGLLARGADPAQAACWGTYLHAIAGDRLAARVGRLGFLARDLVDQLPLVLTETEA
jgi:ADP-dependent NAD(P)H-hydrate dehydratase